MVVQAIPTYTISCFKLPLRLCNDIEKLVRNFWWGQRGDRRKIHSVKWDEMCNPKIEGGMGFKDFTLFKSALLAKQTWLLLHNKNSLFYRVFKSKFFPNCLVMDAKDSQNGSYEWRSILKGRDFIKNGARWRIGNGNPVNIWSENWLSFLSYLKIQTLLTEDAQEVTLSSFINPFARQCDVGLLNNSFSPTEVELILKIHLNNHFTEDVLYWNYV